MGQLTYSMMASLDGYVCDENGMFDWGQIDAEVHDFANREMAQSSLEIYGRRMYEIMVYWESVEVNTDTPDEEQAFAQLWQAADKIVASSTLGEVPSGKTRLIKNLSIDNVADLRRETSGRISISGPTVAAPFLTAGLVDEISVYTIPVLVGGGTPMFAPGVKLDLERTEFRTFGNGVTFTRFRPRE